MWVARVCETNNSFRSIWQIRMTARDSTPGVVRALRQPHTLLCFRTSCATEPGTSSNGPENNFAWFDVMISASKTLLEQGSVTSSNSKNEQKSITAHCGSRRGKSDRTPRPNVRDDGELTPAIQPEQAKKQDPDTERRYADFMDSQSRRIIHMK